jgi:mono/diheme cytochrome c family protein
MARMAFMEPLNAHSGKTRRAVEAPVVPADGDLARGQQLYTAHCASCHGDRGNADGPGAAMLRPRPKNLSEEEFSQDRIAETLWNGVDGTSMPAWRDLPINDLAALTRAVRALYTAQPDTRLPDNIGELGARVFAANCIQCHGERGAGDGPAAVKLPIAPTDFRRQRPTLAEGVRVLRDGVPGTPMAPWTDRLSDAERLAAAQYVRSFYVGDRPR